MTIFLLSIALLLTLMWVLIVRPQRRRQAKTALMQDRLAPGDEIVTAGGLYGRVESDDGDDLRVEIAPGTTVRIARRAVVGRVGADGEPLELEAEAPNSADGR